MISKIIASMMPLCPEFLVWKFSKRYIAGKQIDDVIKVGKVLNLQGAKITIDLLGEFIDELSQAEEYKNQYLEIIEKTESAGIDGNYSLKPTMFGLLLDKEVCYNHVRDIVAKAAEYNNFVRIDMEDSSCTDMEIELFRRTKKEFPKNVGLVLQAYLKRTLKDVEELKDLNSDDVPLNFRLCKGIYVESTEIAYKEHDEINRHYIQDLEYMLSNKIYPGIATHDKVLVEKAFELIDELIVSKNMYEFQMLYGVTPALRKKIIDAGHNIRIYVPFGEKWFNYSVRRLKENPGIIFHIIKSMFLKG